MFRFTIRDVLWLTDSIDLSLADLRQLLKPPG